MKSYSPGFKIGLLGGGQLARMLGLQGHRLGFEMHALSSEAHDPAAQVLRHHHLSDLNSQSAVEEFLKGVDVATFESEFLDAEMLERARKNVNVPIHPSPSLMGRLQDRLTQKRLLEKSKIPALPFIDAANLQITEAFMKEVKSPLVLKRRRFGYDGYGTFHVKNVQELERVFQTNPLSSPMIAEPRCRFKREFALSFCRGLKGQIIEFPLVETKQENTRCLWVRGPVGHSALKGLSKRLRAFLKAIDYTGMITFELFDIGRELLVNEIAPRVHNSAHYTLDAATLDQFSAHLLAITGLDLPPVRLHNKGFAMMNLLGSGHQEPTLSPTPEAVLHWYGKSQNRAGRKMGHLNAVAQSPQKALLIVKKAKRNIKL